MATIEKDAEDLARATGAASYPVRELRLFVVHVVRGVARSVFSVNHILLSPPTCSGCNSRERGRASTSQRAKSDKIGYRRYPILRAHRTNEILFLISPGTP